MNKDRLVLLPVDVGCACTDIDAVNQGLRDAGFINGEIEVAGETRYRVGERFPALLTFLGCSPHLPTAPAEAAANGDNFYHVSIAGVTPRPAFIAGERVRTPGCPDCGRDVDDWRALAREWQEAEDTAAWRCRECGCSVPITGLNWRRGARFARMSVTVWNVFDGEAVPGEELLAVLEQATGCRWQHFFCRGEAPV